MVIIADGSLLKGVKSMKKDIHPKYGQARFAALAVKPLRPLYER
jgi:hypothetical protein